MTEAIYLDIDGTLRDEQKGIPKSAIWALEQCRKQNIKVIICTGRNPASIQNDVQALSLDGMISGGGCYIRYRDEILWKKYFSPRTIEYVLRQHDQGDFSLAMETETKIWMDEKAFTFYRQDIEKKLRGLNEQRKNQFLIQNKIVYEANLKQYDEKVTNVHKLCMAGEKREIERIQFSLRGESEIGQEKLWNGRWYLELLPRGCDKGKAVQKVNQRLGISKDNTISFGDSENDIAMMKETGTAVAVGSCSILVQECASSICEPVMEDGLYKELVRRKVIRPDLGRNSEHERTVVAGGSCISDLSEELL
ncbi:Cof-type HAD-IIB family hydrolase [Faecalicatena sp. AGMB00832]|uniref:Cof-type HAD-IIB family hydrolase n=1 Tax=Faecalicatena faecalis TaxID=2726362 RepID=A0ABS6D0E6_9FIRM|nr:HAD family hydrolase [Faecalicatena faecalis]MBU3874980.1 Cof-type HAD-IIB family hydrolase [Faecalicatena faecalis]